MTRYKKIKNIECPKCKYNKNKGTNFIVGFIQVTCKCCGHKFQYDHIFKVVVPFGYCIDILTREIVKLGVKI